MLLSYLLPSEYSQPWPVLLGRIKSGASGRFTVIIFYVHVVLRSESPTCILLIENGINLRGS